MKKFKLIAVALLFIGFTSCEDYLDVNQDPNKAQNVDISLVLASAQSATCVSIGGYFYNLGGMWSQYYTQSPDASQYQNIDEYNITPDFFDDTYRAIYSGALTDYDYIKSTASESGQTGYYLIATLMESYTFQVVADIYGAGAYSEAIEANTGNLTPKYDQGVEIYSGILAAIDDAVTKYNNAPTGVGATSDIIFGGDMNMWIQFANTLKLKIMMRGISSSTPPSDYTSADIMNLINTGNLLATDAKMTNFENAQNKRNPFYDVVIDRLGGVNTAASNTMIRYLVDNDDARIWTTYVQADDNTWTAKEQGDFANRDINFDNLAKPIFTYNMPVYLFTAHEVAFLQAEAMERFAGGAGAKGMYDAGVTASFAQHGMADTASTYIGAGGVYEYNGADMEARIKQIMTQKWVSMINQQNLEAFFELTRTGYPEYKEDGVAQPGDLTISLASVLGAGQTPKRLLYADISTSRNPNAPAQPAGGIAAPVWWAE